MAPAVSTSNMLMNHAAKTEAEPNKACVGGAWGGGLGGVVTQQEEEQPGCRSDSDTAVSDAQSFPQIRMGYVEDMHRL